MRRSDPLLLLVCLSVTACRNADTDDVIPFQAIREFPPEEEVIAKAYDTGYQAPDDFHVDDRAETSRSYSLYHVKDDSVSYELCTDSYDEALTWETADNDSRAANGTYVGSVENGRYFEFIREVSYPDSIGNIWDPTSPGFARIFKCSYIDRNGVDRNLRNGYTGTLNVRPLTEPLIKEFTEYMWQFTFFWPARKSVLDSFSVERADTFEHTLLLAFLTNQGSDKCDLIEIVDWVYSVSKSDGQITREFRHLYNMESRLINGSPERCLN